MPRLHDSVMRVGIFVVAVLALAARTAAAGGADGTTPLHLAARQGDVACVNLLLRQGARADVANRFGITPLWLACVQGSAPVVEALLKAGADPNAARLDSGETPLMIAARS